MSLTRKTLLQRPFAKPARAPAVAGAGPQQSRAAAAQWRSAHGWRSPWPGAVRVSSPPAAHAWRLHFPWRVRPQARACSGCTQGRNRGPNSEGVAQACTMQRCQRKLQRERVPCHTHAHVHATDLSSSRVPSTSSTLPTTHRCRFALALSAASSTMVSLSLLWKVTLLYLSHTRAQKRAGNGDPCGFVVGGSFAS